MSPTSAPTEGLDLVSRWGYDECCPLIEHALLIQSQGPSQFRGEDLGGRVQGVRNTNCPE